MFDITQNKRLVADLMIRVGPAVTVLACMIGGAAVIAGEFDEIAMIVIPANIIGGVVMHLFGRLLRRYWG